MPSIPDKRLGENSSNVPRRRPAPESRSATRPLLIAAGAALVVLIPLSFFLRNEPLAADKRPDTKTRFVPPTEEQRAAALGPVASLDPVLRRALDPGTTFEPIGPPKRGDWLAEHIETGQTFDEFAKSKANRPDAKRNRIYILPIGAFDPEWSPKLSELSDCTEAFFQMEVRVLPAIPLDEESVTTRDRDGYRQFLTTDLLQVLRQQLPKDGFCILGVLMEDLYPDPKWNYVFGQASLKDRVGIYSFARYDPRFWGEERTPAAKKLLLSRSCGVLVHETCHMFGMHHCIYYECVLNGSNNLEESDAQPLHLCPVCLRKLQHSAGFDVVKRYEALRDVYRRIGIDEEAAWLDARLKVVRESSDE